VGVEDDILLKNQRWRSLFGFVAERLTFLWAVDATEADTFRVGVVQDFDGVAVEDRDDWAGEVGGGVGNYAQR
jgi:hypothetical protein